MRRGDLFRVYKLSGDPKKYRVCVVVSRQAVIDSQYSSVICAPVFTNGQGLSTQVAVSEPEGLKHDSWIACDNLLSVRKSELTQFVGSLGPAKMTELNRALRMALDLI